MGAVILHRFPTGDLSSDSALSAGTHAFLQAERRQPIKAMSEVGFRKGSLSSAVSIARQRNMSKCEAFTLVAKSLIL